MKTFFIPILLLASHLASAQSSDSEAWVSQNLISDDGRIITTESPLNQKTGSMSSVPLEGILARFELWVYPLLSDNGDSTSPEALLIDQEVVGVLPHIEMSFSGNDPYQEPRTRADWEHTISYRIVEDKASGEDVPSWMGHYRLRKRFLDEQYVGVNEGDENWQEFSSSKIVHTRANQTGSFTDSAYSPEASAEERDQWSGVIEYIIATDDKPNSPIPLMTIASLRVRVWPKWHASFENFPDHQVSSIPDNLTANAYQIYPGTERMEVTYFHDAEGTGQLDQLIPVTLFNEPWTASTPQDRVYPLSHLSTLTEAGNYYVRITSYLPGNIVEHADSFTTSFLDIIGESTSLPPGSLNLGGSSLKVRGGIYGLD